MAQPGEMPRAKPPTPGQGKKMKVKVKINNKQGVGLAEGIACQPVDQVDPGSNPTRGDRLESDS